jgi:hypothetical protein
LKDLILIQRLLAFPKTIDMSCVTRRYILTYFSKSPLLTELNCFSGRVTYNSVTTQKAESLSRFMF